VGSEEAASRLPLARRSLRASRMQRRARRARRSP